MSGSFQYWNGLGTLHRYKTYQPKCFRRKCQVKQSATNRFTLGFIAKGLKQSLRCLRSQHFICQVWLLSCLRLRSVLYLSQRPEGWLDIQKDKCWELEEEPELGLKINEHIPLASINRCYFKSNHRRLHETIWNISQCFHGSSPPPSTHTEWRLSQWDLRTFSSGVAILANFSFHKCENELLTGKPKDYNYIMTLVCAYDCCNFSPNSQKNVNS